MRIDRNLTRKPNFRPGSNIGHTHLELPNGIHLKTHGPPRTAVRLKCPFTYHMLCNSASGPEIGLPSRISAGFYSRKLQNRPPAGRRTDFEAFPIRIRPESDP